MNEVVTKDGELVELPDGYGEQVQSFAVQMIRAEVDQQVTTARAFPRSIDRAIKSIKSLATLDEQSAKECIYALPRGGKPIKGPSIRLAEIIASQWGNCRDGARVVHVDRTEKYLEAEGVFHDLETNRATTARVRRRISDKQGRLLSEDMIIVTGNAACSIAKRNAILGGVPKGVWRNAYDAVEKVLAGDVKTLSVRRVDAMKAFAAFGIKPDQIYKALDVIGEADVTPDHLTTLFGMYELLKSGEETVETMFLNDKPTGPAPARPKQEDFQKSPAPSETKGAVQGEAEPAGDVSSSPAPAGEPSEYDGWFTQGIIDHDDGIGLMVVPEGATAAQIKARRDGWNHSASKVGR